MYEKPELKRFGSFRELTRDPYWCSWFEEAPFYERLVRRGLCDPAGGGSGGGIS